MTAAATNNAAVLYIRVSTDEQARHGTSMDAQEERLRAYCVMRSLTVAAVVRDPGVSAFKPLAKRPGGADLLALLGDGTATNVVALKLDRLFRNTADALVTTAAWDATGVALHLVDYGGVAMDTRSATGRFLLTNLAAVAEFERALISERTTASLDYKRAHGKVYGPVPYGCVRSGNLLLPDPVEQATLAAIHRWRADGMTLYAISERLNAEKVPTKRGGKQWWPRTVRLLLKRAEAVTA